MAHVTNIRRHGIVAPSVAAEHERVVRRQLRGAEEEVSDALLAVRHAIAHEQQVAHLVGLWRYGEILVGIDGVVHELRCLRA
jgi:hypothetical protein